MSTVRPGRVDAVMFAAAILLMAAAGFAGAQTRGVAILVVVVWAAGRLVLDGQLARPGRAGHLAATAAVAAVLIARTLPETVAIAAPLAVVGIAALVTAPSTRAKLALTAIVAAIVALAWLTASPRGGSGFGPAQVAAVALIAIIGWNAWRLLGQLAILATSHWRWCVGLLAGLASVVLLIPVLRATAWPMYLAVVVALTGTAYGWAAAWALVEARRHAERQRMWFAQSFAEDIASVLGWSEKSLPAVHESWIVEHEWPGDRNAAGCVITCRFRSGWQGSDTQLATLIRQAGRHFGGVWAAEVHSTSRHVLLIRQADPFTLPDRLSHADLPSRPGLIPLGVRADGQPFGWDLTVNAHAHCLIFGATGSGKTNLTNIAIAAFAQSGALIDLIDAKADERGRSDYDLFDGAPCFRLWKGDTGPGVFTEFCAEMDRRRALSDALLDREPVRLLVVDEMWEFLGSSRRQWAAANPRAAAKANPLLVELERVARLGRQYRMRLLVGTQTPSVDDIGGRGVRRQLGFTVALGKVPTSDTDMIFRGPPPAVDDRKAGRGVVEEGSVFVEVQTALLDPKRAAQIAATGTGRHEPAPAPEAAPPDVTDASASRARAHSGPVTAVTEAVTPPVTPPVTAPTAPPLDLTCKACGHSWTTVRAGTHERCPECRTVRRTGRAKVST